MIENITLDDRDTRRIWVGSKFTQNDYVHLKKIVEERIPFTTNFVIDFTRCGRLHPDGVHVIKNLRKKLRVLEKELSVCVVDENLNLFETTGTDLGIPIVEGLPLLTSSPEQT